MKIKIPKGWKLPAGFWEKYSKYFKSALIKARKAGG